MLTGSNRCKPARSEFHPSAAKPDKLQRYVIEACKQSGRNQLMAIEPPVDINSWIGKSQPGVDRFVAMRGGDVFSVALLTSLSKKKTALALIGPEGGLTDEEIDLAKQQGYQPVSLGPTILRMETAAIKIASLLSLV